MRAHHIIRGADDGICVTRVFIADGAVDGATFEGRAVDYLVVFDFVQLSRVGY